MVAVNTGLLDWSLARDREGHREYSATFRVRSSSTADGPWTILNAAGLPAIGAFWAFGNDVDLWAFCHPTAEVEQEISEEPGNWWRVKQKFSTRPFWRCQDQGIENPLLEPPKISGSFTDRLRPTRVDADGELIKSSSHEPIVGIEKETTVATVVIEQNVASIDLELVVSLMHKLNDAVLWGLDPRCVKLNRFTWRRQVWGQCNFFYNRVLEFGIQFDTWDRTDIADTGFKKWKGSGSKTDPANFIVAKDENDETSPVRVLLNGSGELLTDLSTPVFIPPVELYAEDNLLQLDIPTVL